jgi:hypothetical protein
VRPFPRRPERARNALQRGANGNEGASVRWGPRPGHRACRYGMSPSAFRRSTVLCQYGGPRLAERVGASSASSVDARNLRMCPRPSSRAAARRFSLDEYEVKRAPLSATTRLGGRARPRGSRVRGAALARSFAGKHRTSVDHAISRHSYRFLTFVRFRPSTRACARNLHAWLRSRSFGSTRRASYAASR